MIRATAEPDGGRSGGRVATLLAAVVVAVPLGACQAGDDRAAGSPATSTATRAEAVPGGTGVDLASGRDVATGIDIPWGLAFLPDGDALVGERDSGRVLRVPGRSSRGGVPGPRCRRAG